MLILFDILLIIVALLLSLNLFGYVMYLRFCKSEKACGTLTVFQIEGEPLTYGLEITDHSKVCRQSRIVINTKILKC